MDMKLLAAFLLLFGYVSCENETISNAATFSALRLNFFVPGVSVQEIFGVDADLYYVRDGEQLQQALASHIVIPQNVKHLNFSFIAPIQVLFEVSVTILNDTRDDIRMVLHDSDTPNKILDHSPADTLKEISMSFRCLNVYYPDDNYTVALALNFTFAPHGPRVLAKQASLIIHRYKQCFRTDYQVLSNGSGGGLKLSSLKVFFISIAVSFSVIFLTSVVVAYYHVKTIKPSQQLFVKSMHHGRLSTSDMPPPHHHQPMQEMLPVLSARSLRSSMPYLHPPAPHTGSSSLSGGPAEYQIGPPAYYGPTASPHLGGGISSLSQSLSPASGGVLPGSGILAPTHSAANSSREPSEPRSSVSNVDLTVNRSQVELSDIILEGTFGMVHNGVLAVSPQIRRNIFVKSVNEHASADHIEVMLRECSTFKQGVEHLHVLPLCAIVLDEGSPMAIYPQTAFGNLKLYLRQLRDNRHNDALTTRDVVGMAIQILHGLQYIVKKKIEFSDLATRNCYLDEGLTVKISDNALARDIFPEDYQCLGDNVNRPIKWLAIEAISKYIYSPASDVWSFGITLWELWTLADQPYMDIDPFEMVSFLKEGGRLYQPSNCPDPLYRCMCCCWAYDATERPTISKLIKYLEEFYRTLGAFF